jgi:hypothetical protein
MKFKTMFLICVLMVGAVSISNKAKAASDTGTATATVIAGIDIVNQSDLEFGIVAQGDAAGTVAPGDGGAAEFLVTGQANTAYTITLPAAAINMTTGAGDTAQRQISVSNWVSNPAAGANGMLDGSGEESLFVGADHAAILNDQEPGAYSGVFTVDVVY